MGKKLEKLTFVVPGSLASPTGGFIYDRRVIEELGGLGIDVRIVDLGSGFPFVSNDRLDQALDVLLNQPKDRPMIIDGLAYGVMGAIAGELAQNHRIIALVHHPLALETGLTEQDASQFRSSETKALSSASHIIVTSKPTRDILVRDYGSGDRDLSSLVSVVAPGFDRPATGTTPTSSGHNSPGPFRILSVGSMISRKGHDVLITALARLDDIDWQLTIVGDLTASAEALADVQTAITRFDLTDRVTLSGAVPQDNLAQLYLDHDMFALASRFEGYGMAYAEAVLAGLPIVGTTAGAIPETVPPDCSILVPPDDPVALSNAIRQIASNGDLRAEYAQKARASADHFPTWQMVGKRFAQALEAHL